MKGIIGNAVIRKYKSRDAEQSDFISHQGVLIVSSQLQACEQIFPSGQVQVDITAEEIPIKRLQCRITVARNMKKITTRSALSRQVVTNLRDSNWAKC